MFSSDVVDDEDDEDDDVDSGVSHTDLLWVGLPRVMDAALRFGWMMIGESGSCSQDCGVNGVVVLGCGDGFIGFSTMGSEKELVSDLVGVVLSTPVCILSMSSVNVVMSCSICFLTVEKMSLFELFGGVAAGNAAVMMPLVSALVSFCVVVDKRFPAISMRMYRFFCWSTVDSETWIGV